MHVRASQIIYPVDLTEAQRKILGDRAAAISDRTDHGVFSSCFPNPIHLAGFECCLLMGVPMMQMDWCHFTNSDSYLQKNGVIAILSFDYPNLIWRCASNRSTCQSSRRLRSCRSSLVMRCMSALSSPRS